MCRRPSLPARPLYASGRPVPVLFRQSCSGSFLALFRRSAPVTPPAPVNGVRRSTRLTLPLPAGSYTCYGFLTFTVGFGYNRFYLSNTGAAPASSIVSEV